MTPLDRQLDRIGRDRPLSAPVSGPPTRPSAGGSAQQAVPAARGCVCGHSPVWHVRYRECAADGCDCWAYRKTTRNAPAQLALPGA